MAILKNIRGIIGFPLLPINLFFVATIELAKILSRKVKSLGR